MGLVNRRFMLQRLYFFSNKKGMIAKNFSLIEERTTFSEDFGSARTKCDVLAGEFDEIPISDVSHKLIKHLKINNGSIESAEYISGKQKNEILKLSSIYEVGDGDLLKYKSR